jgi:hypothetical protein
MMTRRCARCGITGHEEVLMLFQLLDDEPDEMLGPGSEPDMRSESHRMLSVDHAGTASAQMPCNAGCLSTTWDRDAVVQM